MVINLRLCIVLSMITLRVLRTCMAHACAYQHGIMHDQTMCSVSIRCSLTGCYRMFTRFLQLEQRA